MEIDESRRPLDAADVAAALDGAGWTGPSPVLLGRVGSTREHAIDLLASGSPAMTAVVAERCTDPGLGPTSPGSLPAGAALWVSLLVPGIDPDGEPAWLANLASLAVVDSLRAAARVPAEITWPDGITVPGAACGGGSAGVRRTGTVRVDALPAGYVVSLVVNVAVGLLELPSGATSVLSDGGVIDRTALLAALLPALARRTAAWRSGDASARADYRERCRTLGQLVDVGDARGRAVGVDERGDLVVDADGRAAVVARSEAALV